MISYTIIGLRELQAKLQRMPPAVQAKLRPFMASATIALREMVKANIAERFRSVGPLYQSVKSTLREAPGAITGRVFTRKIAYAAIQEFGGRTRPHDILPVNGKALAFRMPGRLGFSSNGGTNPLMIVRKVHHPGSVLPERTYARLALYRYRPAFVGGIREIVGQATRE